MGRKLDLCICTHDPDLVKLEAVITAITVQTVPKNRFDVTIVDNASPTPLLLESGPIKKLISAGIQVQLIREPRLGVAYARLAGLRATTHKALIFVDDDNILAPNFLAETAGILKRRSDVGVFSGRILLPPQIKAPVWTRPLWSALALRDCGPHEIVAWYRGIWASWAPVATASMVIRRSVIDHFLERYSTNENFVRLGRKGKDGLMSGEDNIIVSCAQEIQMKCGYFPSLVMHHWISPHRFRFVYLFKLHLSMGISDFWQHRASDAIPERFTWKDVEKFLYTILMPEKSFRVRVCLLAYWVLRATGRFRLLRRYRNSNKLITSP